MAMARRWVPRAAALVMALVVGAASALAQTEEENRLRCNDPSDAAARIPACTALIQAGVYSGQNLAFVYNSRGLAHRRTGQYDRAIQDFDEAIRLSPTLAQAFNNRGLTYGAKGQSARAIQDFDQAIRLAPSRFAAFTNRCLERAILGQLETALADCQESLRLQPNNLGALQFRGVVHLKAGRLDAAIADFDVALRGEQEPYTLYARGVARRRKGDAAGGAADIAAAKAISTSIAEDIAKWGVR